MKHRQHLYQLKLRVPPRDVFGPGYYTKREAESQAEDIFLLHPDERWQETFEVVMTTES